MGEWAERQMEIETLRESRRLMTSDRNRWRARALEAEDRAKRLEHELERAVESREYWQDSHAAALKLALKLAA